MCTRQAQKKEIVKIQEQNRKSLNEQNAKINLFKQSAAERRYECHKEVKWEHS